jgi:hypothetical protein
VSRNHQRREAGERVSTNGPSADGRTGSFRIPSGPLSSHSAIPLRSPSDVRPIETILGSTVAHHNERYGGVWQCAATLTMQYAYTPEPVVTNAKMTMPFHDTVKGSRAIALVPAVSRTLISRGRGLFPWKVCWRCAAMQFLHCR